jgi:hypothetical protein
LPYAERENPLKNPYQRPINECEGALPLKKVLLIFLLSSSVAALAADLNTSIPTCPKETGFYYLSGAEWKQMEEAHATGVHNSGIAKSAFSYGIASAKIKTIFPDVQAPVQLESGDAHFCSVNIAEQGRDIIAVRLEQHKDRRELQTASVRAWTGFNSQFKESEMVGISAEKQGDKIFMLAMKQPLGDGEYMVFTVPPGGAYAGPSSLGGYDFGFHTKK